MTIVIDIPSNSIRQFGRSTQQSASVEQFCNQGFLAKALGNPRRFHYNSNEELFVVTDEDRCDNTKLRYSPSTVSLGFQAIHQAFASHTPLCLRPDTLWYMIVHEIAEHIRQNARQYAELFTETPGSRQTIEVRDDSLRYDAPSNWGRAINLFHDPLKAQLASDTAELFLPRFSTSTIEDETTLLVALMDAASPYYDYVVRTKCGIPQVQLEGTAEDWRKLVLHTELLARMFHGLGSYFKDLIPVLRTIAATAAGTTPDQQFWRSIYKYESKSGTPTADGWITAFFAYVQTPEGRRPKASYNWRALEEGRGGYKTNEFPSHISRVPFIWDYFGTHYTMAFAAGVTNVDFVDGFLTPRLGFAVVEV